MSSEPAARRHAANAPMSDGPSQALVDLRRLEYFLAVVDHDGMGRAANQIHVAQPSLSQAVHVLERELGAPLFERVGRRLTLTSAGRALVEPARRVLEDASRAASTVRSVAGGSSGWIDIASFPMLAMDPIPLFVGGFRQAFPGVGLNIVGTAASLTDLNGLVSEGSYEIGLTYVTSRDPDLEYSSLGYQQFMVVVPPDFGDGCRISRAELGALDWILGPPGSAMRDLLEESLARDEISVDVMVESNDSESLVPLVLAGAGATVLPASVSQMARHRGAGCFAVTPPLRREVALVNGKYDLSPLARSFKEWTLTDGVALLHRDDILDSSEVDVA